MNSRISVSGLCFPPLDLAATLRVLQDVGAGSTTLQARKLSVSGWDTGIAMVGSSGIEVAGLVARYPETLEDPNTWAALRSDLIDTVDAAAILGAPMIYNVTGPQPAGPRDAAVEAYAEFIEPVVAHAVQVGVAVAVEPTLPSFAWVSFIHSLADVRDLDSRSGLGVCLDLRHVWDDPDLGEYLGRDAGRIALVQIGDTVSGVDGPEPAVPGDGIIPLADRIARIEEAGYAGVYDLELAGPRIDREGHTAAVRRGVSFLEGVLTG